MSQLELELSPVVISQTAPILHATSHDMSHMPVHLEPAPQSTC
jgi:hypothetical protein